MSFDTYLISKGLCLKILNLTDVTCVNCLNDNDGTIPSCGGWFEIIAYKHVAFKLMIIPLVSKNIKGISAK